MTRRTVPERAPAPDIAGLERKVDAPAGDDMAFRSFLKGREDDEVDGAVRRILSQVRSKTDCRRCRNCCIELQATSRQGDIERISHAVGPSPEDFTGKYLAPDDEEPGLFAMRDKPCPFLREDGCAHYEARPDECRSFPHLDKEGFAWRTLTVIANQKICPIAFEVYQRLKRELWHRGASGAVPFRRRAEKAIYPRPNHRA